MIRIALVLALLACDPPDRGPRVRAPSTTLRIATKDAIRTLDPAIAYDEASWLAVHPIHDTLLDYDDGTRLVPRLAERYELRDGGRTYHFWLRDGLRYSDGSPIRAADFVDSLERVLASPESPFGSFLADVASFAVVNERELEIRLKTPNAAFLNVLAMAFAAPTPRAHLDRHGRDLRRTPIASGPYLLAAWDEGQRIVLRRNPHYHDPSRQRVPEVILLENLPRETQLLMFERGELDSVDRMSLTHPDFLAITNDPQWQPYIQRRAGLNVFGARFDVRTPPFDDRRVRQAINYAIDRKSTAKLLGGGATPAHGMLPPGTFGRDESLAPYPHDPDRARTLLAEAGHANGLVIEYATVADEDAEKLAQSMQSDLAKVGITMRIVTLAFPAYVTAVGKPGALPFSYMGWIGDYPDPTSFLDPKFHSRALAAENAGNDTRFTTPELDTILDTARAELDPEKRAALYRRAEQILHAEVPWVFDYHRMTVEISQPYVRGFAPHPIWGRDVTRAWIEGAP